MPIPTKFPVIVSRGGSFQAKIYRVRDKDSKSGHVFTVRWSAGKGGVRSIQRRQFDDAKEEATRIVDQLSRGILASETLTQQDLLMLHEVQRLAGDTPPVVAMSEWAKARALVDDSVIAACEHWKSRASKLEKISVHEAVDVFLAEKTSNGFKTAKTQGSIFKAFQRAFRDRMIDEIKAEEFSAYLELAEDHETRRTIRKRIVTLCRWAQLKKFIEEGALEIERTAKPKLKEAAIGTISPDTFLALLIRAAHAAMPYAPALNSQLLCAAVLGGFCGLRRSEIHGQVWGDIDGDELIVTTAKEGTPADRRVPICSAAKAWLSLVPKGQDEQKMAPAYAVDALRKIGREAQLDLPNNCLRHSFISCRIGVTGNVNLTSLEAGNSPNIIHRHYRRPVKAAVAKAWFEVMPPAALAKLARQRAKSAKRVR